jgi:hypothetical protein
MGKLLKSPNCETAQLPRAINHTSILKTENQYNGSTKMSEKLFRTLFDLHKITETVVMSAKIDNRVLTTNPGIA